MQREFLFAAEGSQKFIGEEKKNFFSSLHSESRLHNLLRRRQGKRESIGVKIKGLVASSPSYFM